MPKVYDVVFAFHRIQRNRYDIDAVMDEAKAKMREYIRAHKREDIIQFNIVVEVE